MRDLYKRIVNLKSSMTAEQDLEFGIQLEHIAKLLPRYVRRLCADAQQAEDLAQDVLLLAWRFRASFEGRSSLSTWLYKIAVNQARSAKRKAAIRPMLIGMEIDESHQPIYAGSPPDRCTERIDVSRAITKLSRTQQAGIAWFLVHDGFRNGGGSSTGKVRARRAVTKLRLWLNPGRDRK